MPDMTNIAYTPEYQTLREQFYTKVFRPENLKDTLTLSLKDSYTAVCKSYYRVAHGSHWGASEAALLDPSGAEAYHWYNIDDDGEFVTMLRHSNGHDYLLFRVDLYGYGVYDLTDKKDFFYVPKGPESFIWTGAHYNPQSNVLAVEGCFWACPFGVHLVDFREPMRESKWVDLVAMFDGAYDYCDGADFVRWDGGTLIVSVEKLVEADGKVTTTPEERAITQDEYMSWF